MGFLLQALFIVYTSLHNRILIKDRRPNWLSKKSLYNRAYSGNPYKIVKVMTKINRY